MSYDPNWPQNGQPNDADKFRDQFGSLKTLIDAFVGGVTAVQIDGVVTLPTGQPASVTATMIGTVLHLTFGIPSGNDGGTGATGAQGPPFANAIVDAVNTLAPGTPATVSVSFDGTNVHFVFGIPAGDTGAQGIQGVPGEVTNAALATAISGTSSISNAVAELNTPFANDPPTLADMELMRAKYNELLLALRR